MTGSLSKTTAALGVAALAAFGYGPAVGKPLTPQAGTAALGAQAKR
jgi:hypothetical protein